MAHFAEIDPETNIVLRVIVVADKDTADADGAETESIGRQFCADLFGGVWIQTSYNTKANMTTSRAPLRGNYAALGDTYDADADVFYAPQPFPSWIYNESTYVWEAPTPQPPVTEDGGDYRWDEDSSEWVSNPAGPLS